MSRHDQLRDALLATAEKRGGVLGEIAGAIRRGEVTVREVARSDLYAAELLPLAERGRRDYESLDPGRRAEVERETARLTAYVPGS